MLRTFPTIAIICACPLIFPEDDIVYFIGRRVVNSFRRGVASIIGCIDVLTGLGTRQVGGALDPLCI
jgi:hypothetical protein